MTSERANERTVFFSASGGLPGKLSVQDRVHFSASGGLHGAITNMKDDIITVKIADNVRVEMSRSAVIGYQGQEPVAPVTAQS